MITRKRCNIRYANRKSHTGFRSALESVTLSDLEWPNSRHYALLHTKRGNHLERRTLLTSIKIDPEP